MKSLKFQDKQPSAHPQHQNWAAWTHFHRAFSASKLCSQNVVKAPLSWMNWLRLIEQKVDLPWARRMTKFWLRWRPRWSRMRTTTWSSLVSWWTTWLCWERQLRIWALSLTQLIQRWIRSSSASNESRPVSKTCKASSTILEPRWKLSCSVGWARMETRLQNRFRVRKLLPLDLDNSQWK